MKTEKSIRHLERREYPRVKCRDAIVFWSALEGLPRKNNGKLTDMSEAGIAFTTESEVQIADLIWIRFSTKTASDDRMKKQGSLVKSGNSVLSRVVRCQSLSGDENEVSCCFLPSATSQDELKVH